MNFVFNFIHKNSKIIKYFMLSVGSAILDYIVTYILFKKTDGNYIQANIIGNIAGFGFHFVLGSKIVFKAKVDIKSFIVYVATFLLGLSIANLVLWTTYDELNLLFSISKFLSMAAPFFITYSLRKNIYKWLNSYNQRRILN